MSPKLVPGSDCANVVSRDGQDMGGVNLCVHHVRAALVGLLDL